MKVVLLNDVSKVGKKFEVKNVSDGYALNFLIPRKLALVSTVKVMLQVETLKKLSDADKKIQEDLLMKNLKGLEGATISLTEKANDKGHLFKGIHKEEIADAIKKQLSIDITPEYIVLEKPLKEAGDFDLEAKVQDKSAKFKVVVSVS